MRVLPQFGVNPEKFQPAPRATHPFRIGFVGRLVEEKGAEELVRAVAELREEWELRVLGSGPQLSRLRALTRDLGIAARVVFENWIPSSRMSAYYQNLDLLVVPSRTRPNWKEQFGRVMIEAMACGVAVIGTNCGEIPNVLGNAGIVVPENDLAALRAAIEILRADSAQRAAIGARGRARVLELYTHKRIAAETHAIYREILNVV